MVLHHHNTNSQSAHPIHSMQKKPSGVRFAIPIIQDWLRNLVVLPVKRSINAMIARNPLTISNATKILCAILFLRELCVEKEFVLFLNTELTEKLSYTEGR